MNEPEEKLPFQKEKTIPKKWQLTEGMLIAIGPLFAYAAAFAYTAGYADYFSIPINFVSVSVESALLAIASLALVGLLLFQIANFVILIVFSKIERSYLFRYGLVLALIWIATAIMTGMRGQAFWYATVMYLFFGVTYYGLPALYSRKSGSYMDELEAQSKREDRTVSQHTLHGAIFNRVSPAIYNLAIFSVVIIPLTYDFGGTIARNQHSYLVSSHPPHFAQIMRSGDMTIVREISNDGTRFLSHIKILDAADLSKEVFVPVTLTSPLLPPALDQSTLKDIDAPRFTK